MSPRQLILALSLFALLCSPALANRGGPDGGGYYYIDNQNEAPGQGNPIEGLSDPLNDAPVFNSALDLPQITQNVHQVEPVVDNWFSDPPYNLGIPFSYYGQNIAEAWLTQDGYLVMGNGGAPIVTNTANIPHATAPTNQIAFHWQHQNPVGIANGLIAYGNGGNAGNQYWAMMWGDPRAANINLANVPPQGWPDPFLFPQIGVPLYPVTPPPLYDNGRQAVVEVVLAQNNDIFFFIASWTTQGAVNPTMFGIENGDGSAGTQYNGVNDNHGVPNGLTSNTVGGYPSEAQFFVERAVRFTTLDVIPPGKVTDLQVVSTGCHQITLKWTAPANDDFRVASGPATAYDIRMSTQGPITEANFAQAQAIPGNLPGPGQPGQIQQFVVPQLQDETKYWFALRTRDARVDGQGNPTHWSFVSNSTNGDFTNDCDGPNKITDLTVTASTTTSISLQWTAPSETNGDSLVNPPGAYDLRYSTNGPITAANFLGATNFPIPPPQAPGTTENATVTGLTPDQQYWFAIKSRDEVLANWSLVSSGPNNNPTSTGSTLDDQNPPAISDLAVVSSTGTSVTLQWTAVPDYPNPPGPAHGVATSYELRYSKNPINAGNFANATLWPNTPNPAAAGTVQQTTVTGLIDETLYYFAMIVHDADALPAPRQSALSNVVSGATTDSLPPFAVTDLWTKSTTATSVTLQWTTPSEQNGDPVKTYDLRYSTAGPITSANFSSATPAGTQPSPGTPGTLVTFTVNGLTANNTYWFAIKSADDPADDGSANPPNISPVSNSVFGRTNDTTKPGGITNLTVTKTTGSTVTLTWTAPADDGYAGLPVHYYEVRQSTAGPITAANYGAATLLNPMPPYPPAPLPLAPGSQQTFTATSLAPLTSYWFAVVAFDTVPNAGPVSNSPKGVTQAPQFTGVGNGTTGGGVSNNPQASLFPVLSFDASGNPFVAWADDSTGVAGASGTRAIYARIYKGGTWQEMPAGGATGTGLTGSSGIADRPSVARSSAGTPYLAYEQQSAGQYDIFVLTWNGSAWNPVGGSIDANATDSTMPSLAVGVGETPAVAWQDGSPGGRQQVLFREWNGAAWVGLAGSDTGSGLSQTTGNAVSPSLTMDGAGNPIVAWADDSSGTSEIYVKRFNGTSWVELAGSATGAGISAGATTNGHPSITLDSTGNPVVAWDTLVGTVSQIYAKRFNGTAWVPIGNGSASGGGVSNDAGQSLYPRLCRDNAGKNLFCVWQDNTNGQWQVYTKRYDGATEWKQISGSSASYGGVSNTPGSSVWPSNAFLDATNTYYVAWSYRVASNNYEVYVAYLPLVDTTDGPKEIVLGAGVGGNGEYQVVGNGTTNFPLLNLRTTMWAAYNAADGAVHPSMGDVNNDGLDEVILGTGPYTAAGGWIEVIRDGFGRFDVLAWLHVPWSQYNALNGATYPVAANIDGGPEKDIVFGLGTGGLGYCGAFDDLDHGGTFLGWFHAGSSLPANWNGEVRLAAGDVNGTGTDKIICGFGPGAGGHIEVRNDFLHAWATMGLVTIPYPVYNVNDGGCWPAAGDLDGDGRAEIVVGLDKGGQGRWFAFEDASLGFGLKTSRQLPWSYYDSTQGELRPAAGDFSGKQRAQIVLGTGTFTVAGGYAEVVDDAVAGFGHLAWIHFGDAAYDAKNGELFPAAGNIR